MTRDGEPKGMNSQDAWGDAMTRDEMKNELANIECHIRTFLPAEYLESIGANVQAPSHKRELHHRCMRIFDDLATRLSTPAPSVTVSTGSEIAVHVEEYAERLPAHAAPARPMQDDGARAAADARLLELSRVRRVLEREDVTVDASVLADIVDAVRGARA